MKYSYFLVHFVWKEENKLSLKVFCINGFGSMKKVKYTLSVLFNHSSSEQIQNFKYTINL